MLGACRSAVRKVTRSPRSASPRATLRRGPTCPTGGHAAIRISATAAPRWWFVIDELDASRPPPSVLGGSVEIAWRLQVEVRFDGGTVARGRVRGGRGGLQSPRQSVHRKVA